VGNVSRETPAFQKNNPVRVLSRNDLQISQLVLDSPDGADDKEKEVYTKKEQQG